MALKSAAAAAPRGLLRRLFSTTTSSAFIPPPTPGGAQAREQPEPSTNLFVSGGKENRTERNVKTQFLDGWVIFAEYARPRPPPGQPGNNMTPPYARQ